MMKKNEEQSDRERGEGGEERGLEKQRERTNKMEIGKQGDCEREQGEEEEVEAQEGARAGESDLNRNG